MSSTNQPIQFKLPEDDEVSEKVMVSIARHWMGGVGNIENTFDQVMDLVKRIPPPSVEQRVFTI